MPKYDETCITLVQKLLTTSIIGSIDNINEPLVTRHNSALKLCNDSDFVLVAPIKKHDRPSTKLSVFCRVDFY